MKFYLVNCKDHGWIFFDEHLRKEKNAYLQCFGGHRFLSDTRASQLYEAQAADLPDTKRLTDKQKSHLLSARKIKPVLFWFGITVTFTCPTCKQVSAEKLTLNSPFQDLSLIK